MTTASFDMVVAIPAKDEAALLPSCLRAIGRQKGVDWARTAVVVAANNCSDDTAVCARAMAANLPFTLIVQDVVLSTEIAHAGGARRAAMDAAALLCGPKGVIVTTDADGVPDEDWLASYRAAFDRGVDMVAGRVSTNWEELQQFPADVLAIGALEWEYQGLTAELEARCDPVEHDPWPNHNQTCGANIAIRRSWYERIGGLPVLRTGEDGALFREVWRRDGRIRHDRRPHVTVSARLVGRAQGGMADALAARHGDDYRCDELLEPAEDLMRRARWRAQARRAFARGEWAAWAASVGIDPDLAKETCGHTHFGAAWLALEDRWPGFVKRRIAAAGVGAELAHIRTLLKTWRAGAAQELAEA